MEIKEQLTSVNRTVLTNKINEFIVIHYVGAVSTAKNNADYFKTVNRQASANYFVDENEIYRVVKDSDKAWHCGSNKYKHPSCRNENSIGIEMCCFNNNGKIDISEKVVSRTIELTKELMKKYNIPATNVLRHYDVTGKSCPEPFVSNANRWNEFKAKLSNNQNHFEGEKVTISSYYKEPNDDISKAIIPSSYKTGTIAYVQEGSRNPYMVQLDNGQYWCNDGDIRDNIVKEKATVYYNKCDSKYNSLVDALNSIGVDSSFNNRKKIALKNYINEYIGTAYQNSKLLDKLKVGRLIK